jgi:uracil-DNA glycosylase family 4
MRIAKTKRRSYQNCDYWGKPVPAFGSFDAKVLLIGLAPGAHGANRTGRMFTGDRSGDFLYRALHETGFASQPTSVSIGDGLKLTDCYITAPVRCAPPDNKPNPQEFDSCRPFLERELALLPNVQAVVALGNLALRAYLGVLKEAGRIEKFSPYAFGHGVVYRIQADLPALLCCYHPSQQNTQTGRLTADMMRNTLFQARRLAGLAAPKDTGTSGSTAA